MAPVREADCAIKYGLCLLQQLEVFQQQQLQQAACTPLCISCSSTSYEDWAAALYMSSAQLRTSEPVQRVGLPLLLEPIQPSAGETNIKREQRGNAYPRA